MTLTWTPTLRRKLRKWGEADWRASLYRKYLKRNPGENQRLCFRGRLRDALTER